MTEQQRSMKEARDRLEQDWKNLLAEPFGRRVVANLLKACAFFGPSQLGSPEVNAFNLGKRSVGDFIVSQMTAADAGCLREVFRAGYGLEDLPKAAKEGDGEPF